MKHAACRLTIVCLWLCAGGLAAAGDWPQLQGDALRSGNAPQVTLETPLGLTAAVPLTDGIYASPVVSDGAVYCRSAAPEDLPRLGVDR